MRFVSTLLLSLFLLLTTTYYLPSKVSAAKRIEVDLNKQSIYAFDDANLMYNFLISSGKWAPTPKGSYSIYWKTPSMTMSGGDKRLGTYYNLPKVPYNMFFHQGYALHGAYKSTLLFAQRS